MNNFLSLSLTVLAQRATPPPPVPKMGPGGPPPPVGDVPLDGSIWLLIIAALVMGAVIVYRNRERAL